MEKKITKVDLFNGLKALVNASTELDEESKATYLEGLDKELASLEKRKESAQKRAAAKKEESDALTEEILTVVKNAVDVVLVDDIVNALEDDTVTRNKVTARLGKLVNRGDIVKEIVKVEGSRKMGYKIAEA